MSKSKTKIEKPIVFLEILIIMFPPKKKNYLHGKFFHKKNW